MLTDLSVIHFQTLQALEGIEAQIKRGSNEPCSATVVLGRVDAQAQTTREATYTADAQDVLILAADYKPTDDTPTAPEEADQITITTQGETLTLDARPPGDNQQCFTRWRGNAVYRVHTKIRSRAPAA